MLRNLLLYNKLGQLSHEDAKNRILKFNYCLKHFWPDPEQYHILNFCTRLVLLPHKSMNFQKMFQTICIIKEFSNYVDN